MRNVRRDECGRGGTFATQIAEALLKRQTAQWAARAEPKSKTQACEAHLHARPQGPVAQRKNRTEDEPAEAGSQNKLMPKMPHPGKHHRKTGRIGSSGHLVIADRSARLDHGGRASLSGGDQPVGEGEEGV